MSASAARRRAISGSFSSSPGWKRVFSSIRTWPGSSLATASSATGPRQSSAKNTSSPSTSRMAAETGRSDIDSTLCPRGRSKWLTTMTLAPDLASSLIVGETRSMRLRSVMRPSRTGTLRSTRSSTRLPRTSNPSMVLNILPPEGPERRCRLRARVPGTGGRPGPSATAFPRVPQCPTCGWKNPIRCRTSRPRAASCRRPRSPSAWHRTCRTRPHR